MPMMRTGEYQVVVSTRLGLRKNGKPFQHYQEILRWVDPAELEPKDPYAQFKELQEMKRRAKEVQKTKGKYVPHQDPFLAKYPEIQRVLWDCWYDDGGPRELGKLTISLVPSGVAIALTDPGERASAFTTAESLPEALELLEAALGGKADPWRPWPKGFGKKSS